MPEEKREGEKETKSGCEGIVMKIEVVREQVRTRERVTQTERGGVADGDMLIYELQGFSLTILSFTETEKERKKERQKAREADGTTQNWRTLRGKLWGGNMGKKMKFSGVMLLIL